MNALVTVKNHPDVRGNEMLYLIIQGASGEIVINIGKKNFDELTKILQPRQVSTQLNILPPETKK